MGRSGSVARLGWLGRRSVRRSAITNRVRVTKLAAMKRARQPIACVTAYDHATARLVDEAQIPVILVGDTLGEVVLGLDSTIPVTLDDIVHHTKAVVRGARRSLIVADMPFMTYQTDTADALRNASRLLQEGGAQAIKLEGGEVVADSIRRLTECGIPVMAHIGLQPQSVHHLGGYRARGRTADEARQLLADALAVQAAGAFAVVLELIPGAIAAAITKRLEIPTIGIGAGPGCDGQIQVISDILGLGPRLPRHSKQYASLNGEIAGALASYAAEVAGGGFPSSEHTLAVDPQVLDAIDGAD
ncbi:MAG: 3-methyl-2-oxobutanoate hydroxymethyltransferase [Chloroflexi bacterium]|nr:3-methyl-2-oxobutanoate hydroxymethyltransferase [Chloroflexota bacterium]